MKVKGVSYADAITKTGSIQSSSKRRFKSQKKDITRNANIQSKKKWYRTARVILTASQEELRHNKKMIDWLKKKRGITKRTALEVGLGYNPETRLYFRKEWGLTKEIKPDGKEKMVYLPKGFIIPMTTKIGRIVRLRIRMDKPIGESRYISVTGSRSPPLLFGNWKAKICLIVESELDAILLYQEIKNVFVIALGSATNKLTRNQERLLIGKEVYLSLDSDDAGVEATGRLIEKYPIFKVLPIIEGKDHTEAFLNDLDLKEWFNVGRKLAK